MALMNYFRKSLDDQTFHPDINGFTIIVLIPPDLSGYPFSSSDSDISSGVISSITHRAPFLALDFTPPETTVNTSELTSGSSIRIPFAISKQSGGNLSISYIETSDLAIKTLHNIWVQYIHDVLHGIVDPSSKYIEESNFNPLLNSNEFGALDYATSAYVIRYKPDMKTAIYIGKAVGIFPVNLPSKEVIGVRSSNELTMLNVNYICADYVETTFGPNSTLSETSWIVDEFFSNVYDRYS
jgi:hypothetical protein